MSRRVCLIFDSDSQMFACINLVPHFKRAGWEVSFTVLGDHSLPDSSHLSEGDVWRIPEIEQFWARADMSGIAAVGAYLPGSKLRRLWEGAAEWFSANGSRPLLFTGYNGVVLGKFEEGLSWRTGYDLVALNSPEDHANAMRFHAHGTGASTPLMPVIGINRKHGLRPWAPATDSGWEQRRRIVFAEQVMFPRSNKEKFYLYSHLLRLSLANPEWEILIKPRTLPGGTTFHRQNLHVSDFLADHFVLPANMRVCYDPLDYLLPQATVLLSISSTAFFDALALGIPSYTLSDFGVSNAYGTAFFHGAGTSVCLAEITTLSASLFRNRPAAEWLSYKGFDPSCSPKSIVNELEPLLSGGTTTKPPLPPDREQRLLNVPAEVPSAYRATRPFSLGRTGRRVMKYITRRLSARAEPGSGQNTMP